MNLKESTSIIWNSIDKLYFGENVSIIKKLNRNEANMYNQLKYCIICEAIDICKTISTNRGILAENNNYVQLINRSKLLTEKITQTKKFKSLIKENIKRYILDNKLSENDTRINLQIKENILKSSLSISLDNLVLFETFKNLKDDVNLNNLETDMMISTYNMFKEQFVDMVIDIKKRYK